MFTPLQIAPFVLHYLDENDVNVTPMKLQKLLYYIHVWSIVAGKQILQSGSFKAWKYGPVNDELYYTYKDFGKDKIDTSLIEKPSNLRFTEEQKDLILFITKSYQSYSAIDLSNTTHEEDPWKFTDLNQTINEASIYSFYKDLPFANNFVNKDLKGPFIAPMTASYYAFAIDFNQNDKNVYLDEYENVDAFVQSKKEKQQQLKKQFNF